MSISAEYVRVKREDYDLFLVHPESMDRFFGYIDDANLGYAEELRQQGRTLVLGTLWQAIYYLLTNEAGQDDRPGLLPEPSELERCGVLAKAVFGGRSVQFDYYNDVTWYLSPEDVLDISRELDMLTPEAVREAFENRKHEDVQIYRHPAPSTWTDSDLEFLLRFYSHLRDFYFEASKEGDAVFVWIG